jgi:xanthine dehydrogenase accessory factor
MSVWPTIEQYLAERGAAALVTLAEARGSSPREVGARMVVRPDGVFSGTIGGGALEWAALAEAQALLARRGGSSVRRFTKALGPDLGQCCGGQVTITIERFDTSDRAAVQSLAAAERSAPLVTLATADRPGRLARRVLAAGDPEASAPGGYARLADGRIVERFAETKTPLYLFGAGHVGRALAVALAPLPFAVTWIDPRPTGFPQDIPVNATSVVAADPVRILDRAPNGAFIAVMTHSHALDLDLVIAALQSPRFGYVGLIGSATKRARFASAMGKIGMAASVIARLNCPIGLTDIRDKAPAVIAASVVARLLIAREAARAAVPVPGAIADGRDSPRGAGNG